MEVDVPPEPPAAPPPPRKRGRPPKKRPLEQPDNRPSTSYVPQSSEPRPRRTLVPTKTKLKGQGSETSFKPSGPGGKPAELYRTDLITAMKISDDAAISIEDCLVMEDPWRHEWNKGVQVPVAHDNLPVAKVKPSEDDSTTAESSFEFKLPKKYVRMFKDDSYDVAVHSLSACARRATTTCRYDLDDLDLRWLELLNSRRNCSNMESISEQQLEQIIECLETLCYDRLQAALLDPSCVNLGREFDEQSVCDICLSPYSDDDDEIVFCDGCDLCVHQSCYGVVQLPEGQWLCRACALSPGHPPTCVLCPNTGGAMKCTRTGERWAHVSCVIWIPETEFGDPDRVEPVVHLCQVPEERWTLRCSVCEKRQGACIQCSHKSCRTAYHVTCAQRRGLQMAYKATRARGAQGVDLVSLCAKHSRTDNLMDMSVGSDFANINSPSTPRSPPNSPASILHRFYTKPRLPESPAKRKAKRMTALQRKFYNYVSLDDCAQRLKMPVEYVSAAFEYWKMKRRANFNKPLLTSREDEEHLMERQEEEALVRRVKMLVALRQNLEKARNLCYMLERREKCKKHYMVTQQQMFERLHSIVDDDRCLLSRREVSVLSGYLEPTSIYDDLLAQQSDTSEPLLNQSSETIQDSSVEVLTPPPRISEPRELSPDIVVVSPKTICETRDRNYNLSPVEPVLASDAALPDDSKVMRVNGVHPATPKRRRPNGFVLSPVRTPEQTPDSSKRVSKNGFHPIRRPASDVQRRVTRSTH